MPDGEIEVLQAGTKSLETPEFSKKLTGGRWTLMPLKKTVSISWNGNAGDEGVLLLPLSPPQLRCLLAPASEPKANQVNALHAEQICQGGGCDRPGSMLNHEVWIRD